MAWEIILTIFLILLNGFFVAAEFAIVKVRASQIELKTAPNSSLRKIGTHITDHLEAYLAATQLGITIASLGLGWIGEGVAEKAIISLMEAFGYHPNHAVAHEIAMPVAFMFITFLHVVFGELAPKSIAIRYALPTTIWIAIPLRIFYVVSIPIIFVFNGFANLLLRALGIAAAGHEEAHSEEELRILITESGKTGTIKGEKIDLLENVFNFDDKTVKQIMIPRPKMFAIDMNGNFEENITRIITEGYSRVPVYRDNIDEIAGVLYAKDLLKLLQKPSDFSLETILKDAYFVPSVKKLGELLQEFQKKYIQMAIVTDEYGGTVGLVTMEDIVEELLGEIYDEYDEKADLVIKVTDGEFIVNALVTIDSLNHQLPLPLTPARHYDTLSGLLLYHLARIPSINETLSIDGYEMTVLQRSPSRVEIVGLKLLAEKPTAKSLRF